MWFFWGVVIYINHIIRRLLGFQFFRKVFLAVSWPWNRSSILIVSRVLGRDHWTSKDRNSTSGRLSTPGGLSSCAPSGTILNQLTWRFYLVTTRTGTSWCVHIHWGQWATIFVASIRLPRTGAWTTCGWLGQDGRTDKWVPFFVEFWLNFWIVYIFMWSGMAQRTGTSSGHLRNARALGFIGHVVQLRTTVVKIRASRYCVVHVTRGVDVSLYGSRIK